MRVLLDTNVLLRLSDPADAQYAVADGAVDALLAGGHEVVLVPQVLYEYWAVATRAVGTRLNGLGLTVEEAESHVRRFRALFPVLEDESGVFRTWFDFVVDNRITSRKSFDVRLAASCAALGLSHVLTFNGRDFRGFAGVGVSDPADVPDPGDAAA